MDLITRTQWGARPAKSITRLPWSQVDAIVVHYTAAAKDQSGDPRVRMRENQAFHMDNNGWADIAYNFAFSDEGDILEGRGWGVMSAATGEDNRHTIAFVFLGADSKARDDVTPAAKRALGQLIREAERRAKKTLAVKGHRDFMATACPGDELYEFVGSRGWEKPATPKHVTVDQARAHWKPGKPLTEMLPGPRPKPDWFWDSLKELSRRQARS